RPPRPGLHPRLLREDGVPRLWYHLRRGGDTAHRNEETAAVVGRAGGPAATVLASRSLRRSAYYASARRRPSTRAPSTTPSFPAWPSCQSIGRTSSKKWRWKGFVLSCSHLT